MGEFPGNFGIENALTSLKIKKPEILKKVN